MPDTIEKKKITRKTNSGIYVSGGEITQSDYDEVDYKELMQDYDSMRKDDCIASSSIDILINPILNASLIISSGYEEEKVPSGLASEAQKFVQETYNQLDLGLKYYVRHKLLALYYGFSMFERVWEKGTLINGKIENVLVDLYPIQQDTIFKFNYDEFANFTGIIQEYRKPEKGFSHIPIDAEYLHTYTPFMEYGNITGRSLLRPARLVWKTKRQVWIASARAASRGAGIPEFIITPSGNDTSDKELQTKLQTIAKNIGNSENSYVISQKDRVEFKLSSLLNQELNIPLIQQANTEMFYNTLSQFVISGIGGNGSRAATGEHKSPYFDALDAIIKTFEDSEDENIKYIIDNSSYSGKLKPEEMPYCVLERPSDTDVIAVGTLINSLFSSRIITKTSKDEVFIREMIGLPEITAEEIVNEKNKQEFEKNRGKDVSKNSGENNQDKGQGDGSVSSVDGYQEETNKEEETLNKLSSDIPENYIDDIFEFDNAVNTIGQANIKAQVIVDDVYQKIIEDIALKLSRDAKAPINLAYKKELIDRLSSVYNSIYKTGQTDINKEYAKIQSNEINKLSNDTQWITVNGQHIMIDGEGKVIKGNGKIIVKSNANKNNLIKHINDKNKEIGYEKEDFYKNIIERDKGSSGKKIIKDISENIDNNNYKYYGLRIDHQYLGENQVSKESSGSIGKNHGYTIKNLDKLSVIGVDKDTLYRSLYRMGEYEFYGNDNKLYLIGSNNAEIGTDRDELLFPKGHKLIKTLKNLDDDNELSNESNQGHKLIKTLKNSETWITINGNHILMDDNIEFPKSQYSVVSEIAKIRFNQKINYFISKHENEYDFYGIRADDKNYEVGDTPLRSRVWNDGEVTDDVLNGTSAMRFEKEDKNNLLDIMPYAYTDYLYVIGTNDAQGGEDEKEIIMKEPKVIAKFKINKKTELSNLTPIIVEGSKDLLVAKVDTLYSAIENSIRDELLLINKQTIDNSGGIYNYIIDRFGQTQKAIKSDLVGIASGGYVSGRNDQMSNIENIDKNVKRMYVNRLEALDKVCDVCRPLNFMTMSKSDAESLGLNFDGSPVNPMCLGGNNCKCTWRPAYDYRTIEGV